MKPWDGFRTERSTDQIVKPVNLQALTAWVDAFPDNLRSKVAKLAPMMRHLGYDLSKYPPTYGSAPADTVVLENTHSVLKNVSHWERYMKNLLGKQSTLKPVV